MISAREYNLICKLKDARNFGYAIGGDPGGKPVFFLGGFPGSRLDGLATDEPARQAGLKVISIDRPGFGLSDFLPKRTFIDIAEDIGQLAQELKIKKFAVMGISGGGPYAAACAMAMPDNITSTTLVSSICP
ncbi:MAG TPA: alpha/beta hydrolase [Desulfitobacteriaceae bacterium]|nr:alpha/beta hydrolase [Desulfitobacteriaceae bacterium]